MADDPVVTDASDASRYELRLGDEVAGYAEYHRRGSAQTSFTHTVVDEQYGCGAHSDTPAPAGTGSPMYEPYDDGVLDVMEKPVEQPTQPTTEPTESPAESPEPVGESPEPTAESSEPPASPADSSEPPTEPSD